MAISDLLVPTHTGIDQQGAGILRPLTRYFQHLRDRLEHRRTIVRLSRMDPRLIRDMGFDPAAIHAALEGSWDETPGGGFRGLYRD